MGRHMFVYDYDGRRVKLRNSSDNNTVDDSESSSLILPPITARNDIDSSRESSSNSHRSSHREQFVIEADEGIDEENDRVVEMQPNGVLTEKMLTRRGSTKSLPPLLHRTPSTIRTARSEPSYHDYSRASKLAYQRYHATERFFVRDGNFGKTGPNDKLVTFYKDFESTLPAIRLIITPERFRSVWELIDALSRLVDVGSRRFIHSPHGHIMQHIKDFEDGGIYFFGPPRTYDTNNYHLFRRQATPELLESYNGIISELSPLSLYRRKRKVKIVFNTVPSQTYPFLIDTARHKSLAQVLTDLSDLLSYSQACVKKVCTRNGKTIQNVQELFQSPDDVFLGIIWNISYYSRYVNNDRSYQLACSDYYRRNQIQMNYYERSLVSPFVINIKGKTYKFEPPNPEYIDPLIKRFDILPFENLEMEWVYGYNGKSCRNNIFILPSDVIVYFVAKVVVLYDVTSGKQRFYAEHTEELRSMAQHPNLWILATGQSIGSLSDEIGHIRIWDSKSLVTLNTLSFNTFNVSVECLAFSQSDNGIKLASITTTQDDWTLRVWDWEETKELSVSDVYVDLDLVCAFDPSDSGMVVSCGKNHVYFWSVTDAIASWVEGAFNTNHQAAEYITCLTFTPEGELITGDSVGFIYLWNKVDRVVVSVIETVHTGSIITIKALQDNYVITGGGSDRTLQLLKFDQPNAVINKTQLPESYGGIVAIATANSYERNTSVIVGTSMNKILQGSIDSDFHCVMEGTSDNMAAVAVNSTGKRLISAGCDCNVTLWSLKDHSQIWATNTDAACTSATFYPNADIVSIGSASGEWLVFQLNDPHQISSYQCDTTAVTCLSYSNNGVFLAAGTRGGTVFVYQCYNQGKSYHFLYNIKSHVHLITSIDWSENETHIRFVTLNYDIDVWNIESKQREKNVNLLRNVQFEHESTCLSYYTAGVWNSVDKNTTPTACSKSQKNGLFCVGTNVGNIRLYHYPCDPKLALYNEVNGHSGAVSHVSFLNGDQRVVTCGESDYSMIQWKIIRRGINAEEQSKEDHYLMRYDRGNRARLSQKYLNRIPEKHATYRLPKILTYPDK